VVAGDVARDRERLLQTLEHLGQCYLGGVFYVDGNEEHKDYLDDLGPAIRDLAKDLRRYKKCSLYAGQCDHNQWCGLLGTNAWWTYDFDPDMDVESSIQDIQDHFGISNSAATNITGVAYNDASLHDQQCTQTANTPRSKRHSLGQPYCTGTLDCIT
jgi:hypothetical protein